MLDTKQVDEKVNSLVTSTTFAVGQWRGHSTNPVPSKTTIGKRGNNARPSANHQL